MTGMDWKLKGKHKDGTPLSGEEVRALVAESELLEDRGFEAEDTTYIGEFSTKEIVYKEIRNAVVRFAKKHKDVILLVEYHFDYGWNPDAFIAMDGEVRDLTGHVSYTYDDTWEKFTF